MKRLLFTFLLCFPIVSFGQTYVQLKHDSTNVWVGQYEHPINSLRARFVDTDSTLAIFGTDNTVFTAARKYNAYTDDSGTPFSTYSALKAYIRQYFFVDASNASGGGGLSGVGGHALMQGDGSATIFNITTNAGFIPSFFTLTTTTPITQNQLNRTVTFPNNNTMRITFQNAPLEGEDTDYVYIVYP